MILRKSDATVSAACRLGLAATLLVAQGAPAAAIFKCVGTDGVIAFQGTPCAARAMQTTVDVREQPLIDPGALASAVDASPDSFGGHAHARKHADGHAHAASQRSHADKRPVSYECRASDGEVFYRHEKCPASVPGDGIARFGVDQPQTGAHHGRGGSRGGAWGKVPVKAVKIPRDEACRAINAMAASGRDGHARDEQVSVYEHNLGRDPCSGY